MGCKNTGFGVVRGETLGIKFICKDDNDPTTSVFTSGESFNMKIYSPNGDLLYDPLANVTYPDPLDDGKYNVVVLIPGSVTAIWAAGEYVFRLQIVQGGVTSFAPMFNEDPFQLTVATEYGG